MATELLSRAPIKKAENIIKPKPPELKESVEVSKVNKNESVESRIEQTTKTNQAKLKELSNSSELIFTKIIENLQDQVSFKPNVVQLMGEYLKNSGNHKTKYSPEASAGIMSNEIFNNIALNNQIKNNPNPADIAQLATITKAGIDFQHSLSQKIVTIQNLVKLAKDNNIRIDETNINKFFDYYDSLEKEVTTSQKELAIAQEPYNGYTLGYHELVANPTKYITNNFRVNPTYNTGDIISSTEEDANIKEIGFVAERKVNSTMSSIEGMVMVVAGPNFSILDTVSKVDSMSFYSPQNIDEQVKARLVELTYQISYAAYQESLIKDYQEADPKKIRKHEVVPKSYIDATNNLKLSEQGITVYQNDAAAIQQQLDELNVTIQQNEDKISALKAKTSKADTGAQKSISKLKKSNELVIQDSDKLKIELMSLELIIEDKQKSIDQQKAEAQSIYENYNPQGLAIPLALSPQGQIEVYQNGLKIQFKPEGYSDYANPQDIIALEDEFNSLLIKHNIRTNAIQIKQNVNTPRVKEAISAGKYTGAIGTSMDYNSESTTMQQAIAMSLNIDDTSQTLSVPLKSTSVIRSR
jgi:hypothetical protein